MRRPGLTGNSRCGTMAGRAVFEPKDERPSQGLSLRRAQTAVR